MENCTATLKLYLTFFVSALTLDYLHYLVYALCIAKGIGSAISYIRAEYPDTAHNHGKMACFGEIMHGDVCALSNSFQPRIFPGGPRDYSNSFEAEAWEKGWI